jgi:hypothetical protein
VDEEVRTLAGRMSAALPRPSPIADDGHVSRSRNPVGVALRSRTAAALAIDALALAVPGCGGGDSPEATAKTATPKATVTQVGPNKFTYELKPGSVQVPGAVADAAVEKQLAAQGIPNATVNCPQNIIVKVGTTVTCDISGAQGAASSTVTLTFSNAEGAIDPSSVTTS